MYLDMNFHLSYVWSISTTSAVICITLFGFNATPHQESRFLRDLGLNNIHHVSPRRVWNNTRFCQVWASRSIRSGENIASVAKYVEEDPGVSTR